MSKKIILGLFIVSVFVFSGAMPILAVDDATVNASADVSAELEVKNVGTLPTSPFYFLKEWRRGVGRIFSFGKEAKAEFELRVADEKAVEASEVEKENPENESAIKEAIENYASAQERLRLRLQAFGENNDNPKIAELIKKIDEKVAKHAEIFSKLEAKFTAEGRPLDGLRDSLKNVDDNAKKVFSAPFENKGDIKLRAEAQIKLAETALIEFKAKLAGLPPVIPTRFKIDIEDGVADAEDDMALEVRNVFARFADMTERMTDHLAKAKTAFTNEKYGEAYGQARSVEVMARNGIKMMSGDDFDGDDKNDAMRRNEGNNPPRQIDRNPNEQKPQGRPSDDGRSENGPTERQMPPRQRPPEDRMDDEVRKPEPRTDGRSSAGANANTSTTGSTKPQASRIIEVDGSNYAYSPSEIRVRKGEEVRIVFRNTEGFHDFVVEDLNIRTEAVSSGETREVAFVARESGVFEYYCSVGNHRNMGMSGKLIVE